MIRRDRIEKNGRGNYNFKIIDDLAEFCHSLGIGLYLGLNTTYEAYFNGITGGGEYIPASQAQKDHLGRLGMDQGVYAPSYDNDTQNGYMVALVTALLNHVKQTPTHAATLIGMSWLPNGRSESCFTWFNKVNGVENIEVLYDYGDSVLPKFKTRLLTWYGNIATINQKLGVNFTTINDAYLPVPENYGGSNWGWNTPYLKAFYAHRQESIADAFHLFHNAVKEVSPNLYTLGAFGNLQDGLPRGTWGLPALMGFLDGMGNNDGTFNDPNYPPKFTTALAIRSRSGKQFAINEFFGQNSESENTQQALADLAAGCSMLKYAAYKVFGGDTNPSEAKAIMTRITNAIKAQYTLGGPITWLPTTDPFVVNLSDVLTYGYANNTANGGPTLRQQYAAVVAANPGKRVPVTVNNNIRPI